MKKQAFVLTLGVVLVAVAVSMGMLVGGAAGQGRGEQTQAGDYRLSGPYTHRKLTEPQTPSAPLELSKT